MTASLHGPLPNTDADHQFNSVRDYDTPLDLAAHGFVEEEFFHEGTAAVYADDLTPTAHVPYTNRLIVRRPAPDQPSSGRVYVEILNPSNGYDAEGLWRRAWDWFLDQRHTYVAFSIKPVCIDALKNYDPVRYAPLSWDLDPDHPHDPVGPDFAPFDVVPGAEEGLAWDVITATGHLLRSPEAAPILGDRTPSPLVLFGQSQSAHYLNTWIRHFHPHHPDLWDAFVISVGSTLERPLRQEPLDANGLYATVPAAVAAPVSVPTIGVLCEGDVNLYRGHGFDIAAQPGLGDGPNRRAWCVAGPGHTEVTSPVMPGNPAVVRAGRKPRHMTPEAIAAGNMFPLQPAITAALDAVVGWIDGHEPPESVFFSVDEHDQPVRDADNNVRGGLRYGLIEHPVATFVGSPNGGTLGSLDLFPAERVLARYPTLDSYLDAVGAVDRRLAEAGYLNALGYRQMQEAARELWTRATA